MVEAGTVITGPVIITGVFLMNMSLLLRELICFAPDTEELFVDDTALTTIDLPAPSTSLACDPPLPEIIDGVSFEDEADMIGYFTSVQVFTAQT